MRVLLVLPFDPAHGYYTNIPHVGLGFIATHLKKHGHTPSYLDAVNERLDADAFAHRLAEEKPDVVGLSFFSPAFDAVGRFARQIRRTRPDAVIVAGGPHVSFRPVQTLEQIREIDYGVLAEGEQAFVELLDQLPLDKPQLDRVPNLAYRENGRVRVNPVRFIENLADLGAPAWDLLRPDRYPLMPNGIFSREDRVFPINLTRGCPYSCAFCGAATTMGRKLRTRPVDLAVGEIGEVVDRYGMREFHVMDDNFTAKKSYVLEFCDALRAAGRSLPWACPNGIRIDSVNDRVLRAMEEAGCYSFAVGIESGDQQVLDWLDKRTSLEAVTEKLARIQRISRIRVTGFFILGLPVENAKTVRRTIRFAVSAPLARANFFNFSPFPGSRIYDELEASGQVGPEDLAGLFIHKIAYAPPGLSRRKLAWLVFEAHWRFYVRWKILWGLAREVKRWSQVRVVASRVRTILAGFLRA